MSNQWTVLLRFVQNSAVTSPKPYSTHLKLWYPQPMWLTYLYATLLSIITVSLVVVSLYLVVVLWRVQKTLKRVNSMLDVIEVRLATFSQPLNHLKEITTGLKMGMQIANKIGDWLHNMSDDTKQSKK